MRLTIPVIALFLVGCSATRQAQADLEAQLLDVKTVTEELRVASLGGATQEELDALDERLKTEIEEAKVAAERVPDAVKEDIAAAKEGISGLGQSADGGLIGIGVAALMWILRDRRKKAGMDPLQRKDIQTPPVT